MGNQIKRTGVDFAIGELQKAHQELYPMMEPFSEWLRNYLFEELYHPINLGRINQADFERLNSMLASSESFITFSGQKLMSNSFSKEELSFLIWIDDLGLFERLEQFISKT